MNRMGRVLMSTTSEAGVTIWLFLTGWRRGGENLAAVLKQRAGDLPAPMQMSDALSRNSPKLEGVEPLQANCLAHGRRQVVEVADHFPEECRCVLEILRDVCHHDALAREQAMSPEQRLRFHQEHSGPLMKGLHESGDRCGLGLASGSLGPLGNGSAGEPSGTLASGCGVRFPDRGAGSDHAGWSSDGWTARNFRRIRTGNPAGTNSGWPGSCPGEWEAAGAAGNRGHPR